MSLSFSMFATRMGEMEGRLVKNIRKAMVRNALRMERAAKRNATGFPKVVTGRLRDRDWETRYGFTKSLTS